MKKNDKKKENKNDKRPGVIIYEEGKKYNSVDEMKRRKIKDLYKK